MKQLALVYISILFFSGGSMLHASPAVAGAKPHVYDHVVIVVEENKDYDQIIGKPDAPYINRLRTEGANFTRMFGEEHHSEGNYFWLFSGSNQDVKFSDKVPKTSFTTNNLGQQLLLAHKSFKGYSEGLPAIDSTADEYPPGHYARKHVPWISFSNIPPGETAPTSANLRFADFPCNFSDLPTVSFVIPNLDNDMHDGSIRTGSDWLENNLDRYYVWAKQNNSLLIVTFDENNKKTLFGGLTNPADSDAEEQNRIATIFAGAHIKPGDYTEGRGITHVNILRTLESMYELGRSGAQQPKAEAAGITDDYIITDVFEP